MVEQRRGAMFLDFQRLPHSKSLGVGGCAETCERGQDSGEARVRAAPRGNGERTCLFTIVLVVQRDGKSVFEKLAAGCTAGLLIV